MHDLSIQSMPAVPHLVFGIFNLAIPNLIFWGVAVAAFFVGCWARMPKAMQEGAGRTRREESR